MYLFVFQNFKIGSSVFPPKLAINWKLLSCCEDWLEMPAAMILLIVVAPSLFASTFRDDLVGVIVCLAIACYLLQEHIRSSGGFRNSFTRAHGISNTIGIIILFVYPAWAIVLDLI